MLSQQCRKFNIMKNADSLYNKDKINVELSFIYLEIWFHYINNSHTNEHDFSTDIDQLSWIDFDMSAESQLVMLSTACNCTSFSE